MTKVIWKKEYERDVTLVLEGIWAQELENALHERLNVKIKNTPLIVFYVNEENLQIWENELAFKEYRSIILKENIKGTDFIDKIVLDYKENLAKLEKFWAGGAISDKNRLVEYKEAVRKTIKLFSIWYYAVTDDRTPGEISEKLTKLRSKDEFFARNDVFIKSCLEVLGVKREFVNLVLPEEFPNVPSESILRKRAKGMVSVEGKQNKTESLEDFAEENPDYTFEGLNYSHKVIDEIKGQIGNKGIVKGKVVIVKNYRQADNVKQGDIIVSPMTTPDFLQAMKRASAFVTNEGGIICHAAIVARELNKPCIMGTKIATQVLKDGDLIEVDANKGIVRIIERA
jgi:phosphohistidine swiveling domain-containing protein